MPFPRKLLNENEDIVLDLHPHWWYFTKPAALLVVAVVGAVLVASNELSDVLLYGFLALIVLSVIALVVRYAKWATTNFTLTTDRLIYRAGVFAKQGREIPLERINDVAFTQSVLERMLGAGSLLIESAGERGQERITDVRHPEQVQLAIYKEAEENNNRMMRGGAPAQPHPSVPEQIEALARLREQGVLTPEEFAAKKQDLLRRM